MAAGLRALIIEATLLVLLVRVVAFGVAVVQHVDADEVGHLVVHLLAFTQLKSEVLVFLLLVTGI